MCGRMGTGYRRRCVVVALAWGKSMGSGALQPAAGTGGSYPDVAPQRPLPCSNAAATPHAVTHRSQR